MRGLLVRVGADQTNDGGRWNAPIEVSTGDYVYVPIPEGRAVAPGMKRDYAEFEAAVSNLGGTFPIPLRGRTPHLDPDFSELTYGDRGARGQQIQSKLAAGDLLVFYASLRDIDTRTLVYALIGLYRIASITPAREVPMAERYRNAHTRRQPIGVDDIVVSAVAGESGRLRRCIPICDYRDRAYRIRRDLLKSWGGLGVRDGYVQRSARLPELLHPAQFLDWLDSQTVELIQANT